MLREGMAEMVWWKGGKEAYTYRYGDNNCYDLQIVMPNGMTVQVTTAATSASAAAPSKPPSATSNPAVAKSTTSTPTSTGGPIHHWQWQDSNDIWRLYSKGVSDQMEKIYQEDPNTVVPAAKINKKQYQINFKTMRQTSKVSSTSRKLRRTEMSQADYELAKCIEESLKVTDE